MKCLVFASAMIAAAFCNQVAYAAAPAECFANPGAAFAAHPNATHASYVVRGARSGGSGRCWYADAFKAQIKADVKPARRSGATVADTDTLRPSIAAPAPQPRATAISPARQLRASAVAPVALPVTLLLPVGVPPAVHLAGNAQQLRGPLPVDEAPADFETRFSASGYKLPK